MTDKDGKTHNVTMLQKWPVRVARPYKTKLAPSEPLVTGQRVIDTLFPLAKGGVAAVPGPFGSGKTVSTASARKVGGRGYRGLHRLRRARKRDDRRFDGFPELKDPRTGESLMKRTVLIANTSDMPVAAREASIYTGITIAEYFRDMGYSVALMADSTSALGGRCAKCRAVLRRCPARRAIRRICQAGWHSFMSARGALSRWAAKGREGALTAIGAVSPPGGDISEPVSQATLRIVKRCSGDSIRRWRTAGTSRQSTG